MCFLQQASVKQLGDKIERRLTTQRLAASTIVEPRDICLQPAAERHAESWADESAELKTLRRVSSSHFRKIFEAKGKEVCEQAVFGNAAVLHTDRPTSPPISHEAAAASDIQGETGPEVPSDASEETTVDRSVSEDNHPVLCETPVEVAAEARRHHNPPKKGRRAPQKRKRRP